MSVAVMALVAALFYGGSDVANKRGLAGTTPIAGSLVTLVFGWLILLTLGLVVSRDHVDLTSGGIVVFALAGLSAPALARVAGIFSTDHLGVSTTAPMTVSIGPTVALVGGVVFFGETLTPIRIVGATIVILGVWNLSRYIDDAAIGEINLVAPMSKEFANQSARKLLIIPIIASLAYGTAYVLRKEGLSRIPDPLTGATISMGAALAAWILLIALVPQIRRRVTFGAGVRWFALGGSLAALGQLFVFSALEIGDLSLVGPIIATEPLMVFALTTVFLRKIERLRFSTVANGLVIVTGTVLVSLS